MTYLDKNKEKEYKKKWYLQHRNTELIKNKNNKNKKRNYISNIKNQLKCEICSETESCCLEFHHINPKEKDFSISESSSRNFSIEKIQKEINKCRILCSNCHKKVHKGILV